MAPVTHPVTPKEADDRAVTWLTARNPSMTRATATWLVLRSHVIEEHPLWPDSRIDREAGLRESAEQDGGQ